MSYLFDLLKEHVSTNTSAGGTISDSELKALVEKACRAPTGYNLQNWHFTAVRSTATKQALFEAAFSQPKILQAAAVIAVSGDLLGYQSLSEKLQPSVQASMPHRNKDG
ncbi:MAG: nitroreductase family protein [Neisseria sp.]|uniref:nitroreductase family protein n=1 Tax=Neisseria sp. TaxID=192066 RepID=UPI0026DC5701|nr:nitroreductase family protein [Neisseria sp.]MDO4641263.1 nitroreductase family protein [Neisseria sp.]